MEPEDEVAPPASDDKDDAVDFSKKKKKKPKGVEDAVDGAVLNEVNGSATS